MVLKSSLIVSHKYSATIITIIDFDFLMIGYCEHGNESSYETADLLTS
jgi:hypothetical protein